MRILILFLSLFFSTSMLSQNIQLHYDFGKAYNHDQKIERKYFTTTIEFFKPDKLGSTFFFVDFDFNKNDGEASLAYFELARKFIIHKSSKLGIQIEFNDGTPGYIKQAWLTGFYYPIKIGDFVLHTSLLYRGNRGADSPDGQLTFVWNQKILNNKFCLNGFLDIWTQDKMTQSGKDLVILFEPQFWYLINQNFATGTEIEISRNFFTFDEDFEFMPTAAIKWTL